MRARSWGWWILGAIFLLLWGSSGQPTPQDEMYNRMVFAAGMFFVGGWLGAATHGCKLEVE